MKTKQETFDIVVAHFLQMRGPSVAHHRSKTTGAGGETCLYRSPDGNKCFAGVLIPDEEYYPEMEGADATSHIVTFALRRLGYDVDFVRELQKCHDDQIIYDISGEWRENTLSALKDLARRHGLDTGSLKNVA